MYMVYFYSVCCIIYLMESVKNTWDKIPVTIRRIAAGALLGATLGIFVSEAALPALEAPTEGAKDVSTENAAGAMALAGAVIVPAGLRLAEKSEQQ